MDNLFPVNFTSSEDTTRAFLMTMGLWIAANCLFLAAYTFTVCLVIKAVL